MARCDRRSPHHFRIEVQSWQDAYFSVSTAVDTADPAPTSPADEAPAQPNTGESAPSVIPESRDSEQVDPRDQDADKPGSSADARGTGQRGAVYRQPRGDHKGVKSLSIHPVITIARFFLTRLASLLGINHEDRPMRNITPPTIRLFDGREIPAPKMPDLRELNLPGNAWYREGMLGFYDETTLTGCFYYEQEQQWQFLQPVSRDHFQIQFGVLAKARATGFGADQVREFAAEVIGNAQK
jgi:hypothetical protein